MYKDDQAAYLIFQFNTIARLDDVEQFQFESLIANMIFSYGLKSKVRWRKNDLDKREIINHIYFIILALSLHLEHLFEHTSYSEFQNKE